MFDNECPRCEIPDDAPDEVWVMLGAEAIDFNTCGNPLPPGDAIAIGEMLIEAGEYAKTKTRDASPSAKHCRSSSVRGGQAMGTPEYPFTIKQIKGNADNESVP